MNKSSFVLVKLFFCFSLLLFLTCCAVTKNTTLAKAVSSGDIQALQSLAKDGANFDERISADLTPLEWSIEQGNENVVKFLIEHGADVNAFNRGLTPLMLASMYRNITIVKLLLCNGADLKLRDKSGHTAFIYARHEWNYGIARLLNRAEEAYNKGGKAAVIKLCSDYVDDSFYTKTEYTSYIEYNKIRPKINYNGNKTISIIVNDKRSYVLSRQSGSEWVGIWRGIFGRVYDMATATLNSLAYDFSQSISNSFAEAGFKTAASSSADRIFSIDILEWMSVSGGGVRSLTSGTEITYTLYLKVTDVKNNTIMQKEISGKDLFYVNEPEMVNIIPQKTEDIFTKILNTTDLRLALTQ